MMRRIRFTLPAPSSLQHRVRLERGRGGGNQPRRAAARGCVETAASPAPRPREGVASGADAAEAFVVCTLRSVHRNVCLTDRLTLSRCRKFPPMRGPTRYRGELGTPLRRFHHTSRIHTHTTFYPSPRRPLVPLNCGQARRNSAPNCRLCAPTAQPPTATHARARTPRAHAAACAQFTRPAASPSPACASVPRF